MYPKQQTVGGLEVNITHIPDTCARTVKSSWCRSDLILIKLDNNSDCITREELFCGNAELDIFVYLVGQVRPLHSSPAGAETSLQGHPFHVFRHLQPLQNIDVTGWKQGKRRKMLCVYMVKWKGSWGGWGRIKWWQHAFNESGWLDFVVWLV